MKLFFERHKYFLLFTLGFVVAEIIVNPLGEFPLNDDWSYAHAIMWLERTGDLQFGNWPAMSLCTHVLWGWLATKIFGFSLVVLRFSSLISAVIGFVFLNKLIVQISQKPVAGIMACFVLLFNPVFFNLSNTFMTDVTFSTLAIMCIYFTYNFFRTYHIGSYIGFVISSVALVLVRQYGIVFPACFILASFFVNEKRGQRITMAIISLIIAGVSLRIYENYLQTQLPPGAMYKFSGNVDLLQSSFWDNLGRSFMERHKDILRHIFIYTSPLSIVLLRSLISQASRKRVMIAAIFSLLLTWYLFSNKNIFSGNIFVNMMLGPETLYESFLASRHNQYPEFDETMYYIKLLSTLVSTFALFACLPDLMSKKTATHPALIFMLTVLFAYSFMVFITESYIDRYNLPLSTIGLMLTSYTFRRFRPDFKWAVVPLLFWTWISIAGTKDYLEWNRQRWNAYWHLRKDLKIPREKINGGFEVNCWYEGEGAGWRDFIELSNFDYLIQFRKEEGFTPLMEYEFQRYFPYKKDKIYIFVREGKKSSG